LIDRRAAARRYRRHNDPVTIGEDLLDERRRRRRSGDPRLSAAGRELFQRMTTGDLVDQFQAALDTDLVADPLLSGHDDDT
jgi:hypothetical protein